jgi:hypothetical protein
MTYAHPIAVRYLAQTMLHACGFDLGLMIDVCYEPGRSGTTSGTEHALTHKTEQLLLRVAN